MNFPASLLIIVLTTTSVCAGGMQPFTVDRVHSSWPMSSSRMTVRPAMPDLIVVEVIANNLDEGVVKVKIKNQGQRNALAPRVNLTMTWGSKNTNFAGGAPTLQPGSTYIVVFDVKSSLVQAKYCATVDPPNKVLESDENNNQLCGQFEGKP